jgi:hypothetical protein
MLRTERALHFVGPAAFDFAEAYVPIETLNPWGKM